MGFRSSWLAVPEAAASAALARTALREAKQTTTLPETGWWALRSRGWFLVIGAGWDHMDRITEEQAHALSSEVSGPSLFWTADDSSMQTRMASYENGKLVWSLVHDETPNTQGVLPEALRKALADQREEQAKEDSTQTEYRVDHLYEVAHVTGKELVGFRHDQEAPTGTAFLELRPVDEPEPTHSQTVHGAFLARLVTRHDGISHATLEATTSVHVESFFVLVFEHPDDELFSQARQYPGRTYSPGETQDFMLEPGAVIAFKIGEAQFVVRPPPPPTSRGPSGG